MFTMFTGYNNKFNITDRIACLLFKDKYGVNSYNSYIDYFCHNMFFICRFRQARKDFCY